jgi:hypothetical protein
MNDNHEARVARVPSPDRYSPEGNSQHSDSLAWIAAAVQAPTIAELHAIAAKAQRDGHWRTGRDEVWCRALRDRLADIDHAAMNLLVAALGAQGDA